MNNRRQLKQAFGLILVVLILIGCGGAEATPTATSTPSLPTEPPASPTPDSALVTANLSAYLRRGPGPHYDTIGKLNADEAASVTGRNPDGSWWQISFQGDTAWIADSVVTANSKARAAPIVSDVPPTLPPEPTAVPAGLRRRVVTGLDAQGKSTILLEDPLTMDAVWRLPPGPAKLADETDSVKSVGRIGSAGTRGMTVGRVEWPPGWWVGMHGTYTLDMGCSLSGQVEMRLQNGSTVMDPGECFILPGTQHGWSGVSDEAFVGVALQVGVADPQTHTNTPATTLTPAPTITPSAPGAEGPGRRIVTGLDAQDRSTILMDGLVPDNAVFRDPGKVTEYAIWSLPPGPADLTDESDPTESFSWAEDRYPPPGGVQLRVFTWDPGYQEPMHQSDTLDMIFVVSGQAELMLENGSTVILPGECVIQRGTVHGWRVVGEEPFTAFVFIVGAER